MNMKKHGLRASLMVGTATLIAQPAAAQTAGVAAASGAQQPGAPTSAQDTDATQEIVVTGQTSRDRPLITASADITLASREELDRRAPKSTADLLELVPGIFVEGTAGEVSNNYSVRGLQGGGQRFIQLEEDGLPIIYQGGGADFFFQQDLTIDRLEAVKGGSSGVLTVNGAGATINFVSRRLNFKEAEGVARVTAQNYGLKKADFYVSAPIIGDKLAFSVGGFIQSNPGVRKNPFDYGGYRVKGTLEYRFDDGGFVRLSGRLGDLKSAYYADQPYAYNNGEPSGIPGLDTQFGNIGGDAFARIAVPVSTKVDPSGFREFRYDQGVRVKTKQLRLDVEKPVSESLQLFGHARYLGLTDDFNGLFPGSGTGNAGLADATAYLTPGAASPINNLLTAGLAAFPTTTRFGIKNLRTGQVLGANQTDALNALNGNGFLQQTTINHDYQSGYDFGSNVGARWETSGDSFKNSLTVGAMYYSVGRYQNQSAVATAVNDVKTNSDLYDVVALDGNNNVIGTLSDNGLVSYGDWGAGVRRRTDRSISLYANDELEIGKLHIDGGLRWESDSARYLEGNAAAVNQPVPTGVVGVVRTVGSTWDGTYAVTQRTQARTAWTIGANYQLTGNFAVYARYANGFQTNNTDPFTGIELYEAGVRAQFGRMFSGSATVFRTNFRNQFYNFIDPSDPTRQTAFQADLKTNGVEIDLQVRPTTWFELDASGVFQDPTLNNLRLNGVADSTFDGNRPERTPAQIWSVSPVFKLPNKLGEIFARYKYVGKIYADSGNGVALPAYGVTSAGINLNLTERLQVSFNAENIFDVIGLTEGNPRQGQRQNASSGYFYARGIAGPTYGGSVTLKF